MKLTEYLIGKTAVVMTDLKISVNLVIKKITENSRYIQITPDTRENDWWGQGYYEYWYTVEFENGGQKTYEKLGEIELL